MEITIRLTKAEQALLLANEDNDHPGWSNIARKIEQARQSESCTAPQLSEAAAAIIAGLVAPTDEVNSAGIIADDATWDEIRAAFPVALFEQWSAGLAGDGSAPGYWEDAGL